MTMHDNVTSLHAGLFSRDGHLTMLTLDRFEVGELSTPQCEAVIEHIESCSLCADRLATMRADAVTLEPPTHVRVRSAPGRAQWVGALAIGATVAAAAALLVMALPQPQQVERAAEAEGVLTASPYTTTDEFEGAAVVAPAFDFSVERSSGAAVEHGARVSWDTALTLHVSPHEAGYVAVVSASQSPDDMAADTDGGGARFETQVLMPVTQLEARSGPHALTLAHDGHIGLDVAEERLVAVFCQDAFNLDDPFDPELPELGPDCTSVEVTLNRFGDVADS